MASKFEILLQARLDKTNSDAQIRQDIKSLEKNLSLNLDLKADSKSATQIKNAISEVGDAAKKAQEHTQGLDDIIGKFSSWQIVGDVIHGVKDAMIDMVDQVFELDASLTELDKVTDLTSSGLEQLADDAFAVGEQIGATGKDVIDATTIFAQAGYEAQEALDLGEQAIMLMNVSEAGATAADSASTLIAAMKAFGLEAEDSNHIVDALNEVSNKYAVSVNDLSTAISKSSASMAAGNNTLEETFGLVTAGVEILREPGRVANGLSTITARLTASNDEYIKSITGGQGVIDEQTGELRSTYDILKDLSEAWEGLTSVEQQELAETVAGKTQRSLFTAIMTNFESAVGATEAALNSEGSAMEENTKRMDSLEGRTKQLQSAWQDFARNTINSEAVKSIISLGTQILKLADTDIGRFIVMLTSAKLALSLLNKAFKDFNILKNITNIFKGFREEMALQAALAPKAAAGISTFSAATAAAKVTVQSLTKALLANPLFWVALGGIALMEVFDWLNKLVPKMEDLEQATEDSTQAFNEAHSETENYKTQLEDINEQIKSIQSKGTLSITDKEDLENLEEQKKGLEANLELAEKIEASRKKAMQYDIVEQMNYYSNNPSDYFTVDEDEKAIEDAKKILKDFGNTVADQLGDNRENINYETQDMMAAYRALGDEISNLEDKINNNEIDTDKYEETQEKLTEMKNVYSDLEGYLLANTEKLSEWYETLEDGDETTEATRKQIEGLLVNLENIFDIDLIDKTEETADAVEESQNSIQENVSKTATEYTNLSESIDELQKSYDTLTNVVDEYNQNGYLSIDTLQSLLSLSDDYLAMLSFENGQLTLNTQALDAKTNALIAARVEQLQAAAVADIYALAEGNTENMSELAQTAIEGVGTGATNMKTDMENAIPTIGKFTQALLQAKAAAGEDTDVDNFEEKADAIINSYKDVYNNITKLGSGSYYSGGKENDRNHSYSGSSNGSSGSSSKSSADTYKAEINTLYKYENALDNAKDAVDRLNDALDNTDNFEEQEKILKQLIDATNDEIDATEDLKDAQVDQINDYIRQLKKYGFQINYNSKTNELYIKNMDRLGKYTGDTAKKLEEMIEEVQDLNDDNRDLDSSIRDLTGDIQDFNEQLDKLPTEKLEKFHDLLEEFQQSRLDQIQNEIDDIQHDMDNDPRLQALEEQIEALEKQNDELDNQKDLEEKLLAVEEAKIALQNAQNEKNIQVYREGQGWVWEADPDAIADAQEELEQAQEDLNDKLKDDQLQALEDEKEAIEKSYQDRIDALEKFLDEQEYLIDKANREGIQSFDELREALEKYGLDSKEYLGQATEWLNNYNKELDKLRENLDDLGVSGGLQDGLIYSSAMQDRIDAALSNKPEVDTSLLTSRAINANTVGATQNSTIYINSIELPNVQNANDFVEALKDLPRLASSQSTLRT